MGLNDLNSLINLISEIPGGIIKYLLRDWGMKPKDLDLSNDDVYKIFEGIY